MQTAFYESEGECIVAVEDAEQVLFNNRFELDGMTFPEPSPHLFNFKSGVHSVKRKNLMLFYIVYVLSVVVLILHFTGFLARRNMDWVVLVAAVAIFAVNILDFLKG